MTNADVAADSAQAAPAKRNKADHEWLGPDGKVVDNLSLATGISYQARKDTDEKGKPLEASADAPVRQRLHSHANKKKANLRPKRHGKKKR